MPARPLHPPPDSPIEPRPPTPDEPSEWDGVSSPDDPDESRSDEATRARGFTTWCREQYRIGNPNELVWIAEYWQGGQAGGKGGPRWPVNFRGEDYLEIIERVYTDEVEEAMTALIRAEASWRADQAATELTARRTGIAPHTLSNRLDYHTGQADEQCGYTDRGGRRCKDGVVPGSTRCATHGGALVDVETRRAILMNSYLKLVHHADTAVNCLVDVAQNSKNDQARVMAAKEILDRAGLSPDLNININMRRDGEAGSPVDKLRQRLDEISDRLGQSPEEDIIEAHVVEETHAPSPPTSHALDHELLEEGVSIPQPEPASELPPEPETPSPSPHTPTSEPVPELQPEPS